MDVEFVDETGVPGCYVVADVFRVAADLPEVLDIAVDMPETQLCLVGDLGYELEIGLGSEQILVTVLLPKDSTADPAEIADCLEQDPMIQTNVIKEEAE